MNNIELVYLCFRNLISNIKLDYSRLQNCNYCHCKISSVLKRIYNDSIVKGLLCLRFFDSVQLCMYCSIFTEHVRQTFIIQQIYY